MLYLLLNVVFASGFTLCIKWVQVRKREDIVTVGAVNYIVAAVWVLPEFLTSDAGGAETVALLAGGVMGACYFVAFFFVNFTIRYVGAAASTVIGVLSILVPISFGVLLWDERPNSTQSVGVVLALLALSLIGGKRGGQKHVERPWFTPFVLCAFFVLAGTSRLAQEAFKHMSEPEQRPVFLLSAFLVASAPSLALLVGRRQRVTWTEFGLGALMGSANILQSHFILKALQYYDGFIVFPVVSAGSLMLTTVVATRLLGERLTGRTWAGIALAVLALVLLNWLPA